MEYVIILASSAFLLAIGAYVFRSVQNVLNNYPVEGRNRQYVSLDLFRNRPQVTPICHHPACGTGRCGHCRGV